jgi:hypothetical protein
MESLPIKSVAHHAIHQMKAPGEIPVQRGEELIMLVRSRS